MRCERKPSEGGKRDLALLEKTRTGSNRGGILDLPEAVHKFLETMWQLRRRLHQIAQPLADAIANREARAVIDLDVPVPGRLCRKVCHDAHHRRHFIQIDRIVPSVGAKECFGRSKLMVSIW
jgi:hypothetical protein